MNLSGENDQLDYKLNDDKENNNEIKIESQKELFYYKLKNFNLKLSAKNCQIYFL